MTEPAAGRDFDSFYARDVVPWMEEKELERRAVKKRVILRAVPVIVSGLLIISGVTAFFESEDARAVLGFGGVVVVVVGLLCLMPLYTWGNGFAGEFSEKIFSHFGYRYTREVPEGFLDGFMACSLLPSHTRRSLEDHVSGKVNGVAFELAEALLERKVRRKDQDDYDLVFRGLVARYDFPKRFNGRTIIRSDFGKVFNAVSHSGVEGERVRLEDPRFEAAFEVFSSDQDEARYLLTPAFMERLVALGEKTGGSLQAAFDGAQLLLAIDGRRNYFARPSVWRDLREDSHVRGFLEDISFIRDIAETLKLDTQTRV
jgi:hypothetical protein